MSKARKKQITIISGGPGPGHAPRPVHNFIFVSYRFLFATLRFSFFVRSFCSATSIHNRAELLFSHLPLSLTLQQSLSLPGLPVLPSAPCSKRARAVVHVRDVEK